MNAKMNINKKIIIAGLILIVAAFYGGMVYGKSQGGAAQVYRAGNFTAGQNGGRGMRGGGIVLGDIIAKDATSVTVQMRTGGSKIILVSDSTSVMKTVLGSLSDLTLGKTITANGTTNADGSVTAQNIQIRQATTTGQ